ncbi:membrane protein insertion efficiency factor YidD [Oceanospirillum sp.]|uniref:membrane protein insertion efficiency factor YidD n=1 Tax=Oceanospirillum sp. TaxID=2021254 RepID=UPI003A957C04
MKYLLKLFVHIYRYMISPLLPNRCIYYPTCSSYALEALETHGAIKGTILAVKRIVSCNPLAKGGYDPVPEKGYWHNGTHPCNSCADDNPKSKKPMESHAKHSGIKSINPGADHSCTDTDDISCSSDPKNTDTSKSHGTN